MTKLIITHEADIERGVSEMMRLARLKGNKKVYLSFPSEFICEVFMDNLHTALTECTAIKKPVDIDAIVLVP